MVLDNQRGELLVKQDLLGCNSQIVAGLVSDIFVAVVPGEGVEHRPTVGLQWDLGGKNDCGLCPYGKRKES